MKISYLWALRIGGAALIVVGIQCLTFNQLLMSRIDSADTNLVALLEEVPSNSLIDRALETMHDYWRANDNSVQRRQITEIRELITRGYRQNPRTVIDTAVDASEGFSAGSELEQELVRAMRRDLLNLQEIYSDQYTAAIDLYERPPIYLQPTASLFAVNRTTRERLYSNYALYLMLVADRGAANSIYTELRRNSNDDLFSAGTLYAQARLQFEAFRVDGEVEYIRQALQLSQESLSNDPSQGVAQLFIEYLLSIDQQSIPMETDPEEGQGSGEAQGERGSLSSETAVH